MLPLTVVITLLLSLVHGAVAHAERWQRPLGSMVVVQEFDFDAQRPFRAGARRGVRLAGRPGEAVRAACRGHVAFAGRAPRLGNGVTLRCGRLAATEFGLERLLVRRGVAVLQGAPLGTLGREGRLSFGARTAARRWGYRDPLALLEGRIPAPPTLAPAPRSGARRPRLPPAPPALSALRSVSPRAIGRAPLTAWLGLAATVTALTLGTTLRWRRARDGHGEPRTLQPARAHPRR